MGGVVIQGRLIFDGNYDFGTSDILLEHQQRRFISNLNSSALDHHRSVQVCSNANSDSRFTRGLHADAV